MNSALPSYVPPSEAACHELARRVCESYAANAHDPSLASWDMVNGMAQFLRAAACILADNLNRQPAEFDNAA